MRFRHRDGTVVHLAYCTNVHPADTLAGLLSGLDSHAVPVRAALGVRRLGVGLWLARDAVTELLASPSGVRDLATALAERGLEVVTLNAFPYRAFGAAVVKGDVYHPDWTTDERLAYTLDCATVLCGLLPADAAYGSVSTLPLAWREPWSAARAAAAGTRLAALADGLAGLDREIRVGLEPEPGCVVETTAQAAALLPALPRVGVCLDACHLAVQFEEPAAAVDRLAAAGLPVVKAQVSCALAAAGGEPALADFVEPRYLHQVRTRGRPGGPAGAGDTAGTDDLDAALAGGLPAGPDWRVHFHVPLHVPPAPPLRSTAGELTRTLAALVGGAHPRTPAELATGIAAELAWTRDRLIDFGLSEEDAA